MDMTNRERFLDPEVFAYCEHFKQFKSGIPNGIHMNPLGVYGSLKGVYESPGVYKYSKGLLGVYDIFYVSKFYFKGM
jgi:hypothetical protein